MKQWEIQVGREWNSVAIARAVESAAKSHGLMISLRGELRTFPGCVHWHFKKQQESGTIEVTVWPQERRVWVSVQSGRTAKWIDDLLPKLTGALRRALRKE